MDVAISLHIGAICLLKKLVNYPSSSCHLESVFSKAVRILIELVIVRKRISCISEYEWIDTYGFVANPNQCCIIFTGMCGKRNQKSSFQNCDRYRLGECCNGMLICICEALALVSSRCFLGSIWKSKKSKFFCDAGRRCESCI